MDQILTGLQSWWYSFLSLFDTIPEDNIAVTVYVGGTIIALCCWYSVAKRLPSPLGALTWIILFACLSTPTVSEGENAGLAPALIGMIFGILTKEQNLIWSNLSAILFVAAICFLVMFFWSRYQNQRKNLQQHSR